MPLGLQLVDRLQREEADGALGAAVVLPVPVGIALETERRHVRVLHGALGHAAVRHAQLHDAADVAHDLTAVPVRRIIRCTGATIRSSPPRYAMPVPWISPVCMMSPSDSENVSAPGAARRVKTDSRLTYSMS